MNEGVWSSPVLKGQRPPPCAVFSFTKIDRHRAVLFGGNQPDRKIKVNDVYLFDFTNMEVTKVEPVQGEPWPVGRSSHAACCLNYDEDHPTLLVSGGLDNDLKVLEDMWMLNVDAGKWKEVTPPKPVVPRYYHSLTATSLGPGLTEVLMFGGRPVCKGDSIAETTILRFESTAPSPSVVGPSTGKWALVDVAHNDSSGSEQRLREKMTKIREAQAVSQVNSDSSQNRVSDLEQQLQASKQREQATQRLLEEANDRCQDAERRLSESEHRLQEAQQTSQEAEQRAVEAERRIQELTAENGRLQGDLQTTQCELEGKTNELAAHNTEVWRIPSNKVNTLRPIGTGGWGEVLERIVRVAMKRLHPAILNQRNLERLQREMRLLAEVRHPNLVQFIGAVFDQSPPLIITELLDMNLRQAYEENQLRPGNRLSIFIDIARALDYLHQRYEPIIHRDVSAPNVLLQRMLNNQWKGKVSDLGSANFLQDAHTMGEGAIVYFPPEVIPQAYDTDPDTEPPPQTVKIDVYSYGIVLCEVTASRFPSQENYREMFRQVQRDYHRLYELGTQVIDPVWLRS